MRYNPGNTCRRELLAMFIGYFQCISNDGCSTKGLRTVRCSSVMFSIRIVSCVQDLRVKECLMFMGMFSVKVISGVPHLGVQKCLMFIGSVQSE